MKDPAPPSFIGFLTELRNLMRNYRIEISVEESSRSYSTEVDGICITQSGLYEENEVLSPYYDRVLPRNLTPDALSEMIVDLYRERGEHP